MKKELQTRLVLVANTLEKLAEEDLKLTKTELHLQWSKAQHAQNSKHAKDKVEEQAKQGIADGYGVCLNMLKVMRQFDKEYLAKELQTLAAKLWKQPSTVYNRNKANTIRQCAKALQENS